jgi:hypothetical protein
LKRTACKAFVGQALDGVASFYAFHAALLLPFLIAFPTRHASHRHSELAADFELKAASHMPAGAEP